MSASKVTYSVSFEKNISRLFLFRPLWLVVEIWVLIGWSLWIGIVGFLHFWYMIVLGKRHKGLWDMEMHFARHCVIWNSYLRRYSNGRPKFIED